jgi:hypothetical protein
MRGRGEGTEVLQAENGRQNVGTVAFWRRAASRTDINGLRGACYYLWTAPQGQNRWAFVGLLLQRLVMQEHHSAFNALQYTFEAVLEVD